MSSLRRIAQLSDARSYLKKELEPGDYVHYIKKTTKVVPSGVIESYERELGRVKSMCEDPDYAFVVYNYGGAFDDYRNYTAARTKVSDLRVLRNNDIGVDNEH